MAEPTPASDAERATEIEARLKAATPGPWKLWEDSSEVCTVRATGKVISGVVASIRVKWVHEHQRVEQAANARFITHAPEDISWLLSERAALVAELAGVRLRLDGCVSLCRGDAPASPDASDRENDA